MGPSVEKLIRKIESLTEEVFKTHIVTGTWTAKEIFAHVAAWDLIFADMSKKMVNGEPLPEKPDFNALNAHEVKKRQHLTRAEMVDEVRKNRKYYMNYLASLTEEQLTDNQYTFTILELAESIIAHDNHHLQQIKP